MTTYLTKESAIAAGTTNEDCVSCIEIEHRDGRCFINIKCGEGAIREALRRRPMPEIKAVIGLVADYAGLRASAAADDLERNVPGVAALRGAMAAAAAEEAAEEALEERRDVID